jgi:hypothetical protein
MAVAIAALAAFAGVADQRAGDGANSTANDSTLCGIPRHGSSYSRATQAANHRALLRARAGAKRTLPIPPG